MKVFHGKRLEAGYLRLWATDETGAEVPWPELPPEGAREKSVPDWGPGPIDQRYILAGCLLRDVGLPRWRVKEYSGALVKILLKANADEWVMSEGCLRAWVYRMGWHAPGRAIDHTTEGGGV